MIKEKLEETIERKDNYLIEIIDIAKGKLYPFSDDKEKLKMIIEKAEEVIKII